MQDPNLRKLLRWRRFLTTTHASPLAQAAAARHRKIAADKAELAAHSHEQDTPADLSPYPAGHENLSDPHLQAPEAASWHERYDARMNGSESVRSMKLRDWPLHHCGDKMAVRPIAVEMFFQHFYAQNMVAEGWEASGPICLPASQAFLKHLHHYPHDPEQSCDKLVRELPA